MKNHLLKCMKYLKDMLKHLKSINKESNNNIWHQIMEENDLHVDQFEPSQSTSSNANQNASAVHNFLREWIKKKI
jgi:hypothetical protein